MSSTAAFSKKIYPEIRSSLKSQLHQTTIVSNFTSPTILEEEKKSYTIHFSEESICNGEMFEIEVQIPTEYNVNESIVLIVGVLNRALKKYGYKLNPNGKYDLFLARKNGQPKLDLPSLSGDRIISEIGFISFSFKIKEIEENTIVNIKKNKNSSFRIANQTYQLPLKKEIRVASVNKNKEENKGKRTFFAFCSCNW